MDKSSRMFDNHAMQWESKMMDKATWNCMRPNCTVQVDPDSSQQYCSMACYNACLSGKASRASHQAVGSQRLKLQAGWVERAKANGYIRKLM